VVPAPDHARQLAPGSSPWNNTRGKKKEEATCNKCAGCIKAPYKRREARSAALGHQSAQPGPSRATVDLCGSGPPICPRPSGAEGALWSDEQLAVMTSGPQPAPGPHTPWQWGPTSGGPAVFMNVAAGVEAFTTPPGVVSPALPQAVAPPPDRPAAFIQNETSVAGSQSQTARRSARRMNTPISFWPPPSPGGPAPACSSAQQTARAVGPGTGHAFVIGQFL